MFVCLKNYRSARIEDRQHKKKLLSEILVITLTHHFLYFFDLFFRHITYCSLWTCQENERRR